jgi:RNA polymerase sigma-70 factor (ECF subfamily)
MNIAESGLRQLEDLGGPGTDGPIEMIYRFHGRRLYRFLLRVTFGDRREAEDLLQETLFRAWRYLQSNTADVEQLAPWLYTVARRVVIDAASEHVPLRPDSRGSRALERGACIVQARAATVTSPIMQRRSL